MIFVDHLASAQRLGEARRRRALSLYSGSDGSGGPRRRLVIYLLGPVGTLPTPEPALHTTTDPNKLETQPTRPALASAFPDTASTTPPPPDPQRRDATRSRNRHLVGAALG